MSRQDREDKLTAKLSARAQPHLEDGEQVEYIIVGNKLAQSWLLAVVAVSVLVNALTGWGAGLALSLIIIGAFVLMNEVRVVAVTDRNVVLLRAGKVSQDPRQVISRLPPDTPLGPPSGAVEYTLRLGGESVHVLRAWWKRIREADAARGVVPDSGPASED